MEMTGYIAVHTKVPNYITEKISILQQPLRIARAWAGTGSKRPLLQIFNLPVNRICPMGLQKLIGLAEMPAPKEPPVCRQGAWMGCLQDQVLGVSQHRAFLLGGPAPQHG